MARDPFSWADNYGKQSAAIAAQEDANAQNALMSVFKTEAVRQQPWSDLPVDLAKQNNAYSNQQKLLGQRQDFSQNVKAPKDALAFGANIASRLSNDLGITPEAASGLVGNLASETGDFKYMQELQPTVPGSKGGAGWAMWTGPRRRDFEAFTGGNTSDPEANYAYLVHDLKQNYPQVLKQLQQTNNPLAAAKIIHDQYLIPGVPHIRKSAIRSQQVYEALNTGKQKQIVGDAEYDRRQARKNAMAGNNANEAFGNKIKVDLSNVGKDG